MYIIQLPYAFLYLPKFEAGTRQGGRDLGGLLDFTRRTKSYLY